MKLTVHLPGPLLPLVEGHGAVELEASGSTVEDALAALFVAYPRLRQRILDEQGRVRPHVNVFVDRLSIRQTGGLSTPVRDGALLSVIPAVSGGGTE